MAARKKSSGQRLVASVRINGHELPLRSHAERALSDYFTHLDGSHPADLYNLVRA